MNPVTSISDTLTKEEVKVGIGLVDYPPCPICKDDHRVFCKEGGAVIGREQAMRCSRCNVEFSGTTSYKFAKGRNVDYDVSKTGTGGNDVRLPGTTPILVVEEVIPEKPVILEFGTVTSLGI